MDSKKIRVLLVEDNEDNRIIYTTLLQHHGLEVVIAVDGPAGLDMARSCDPDVILMDVSIPDVDGWEATRRLKADPATSGIPIIIFTAHALPGARERSLASGADEYLAKPVEPQTVYETINRFVKRPVPPA
jgi:CheY-like chemotaxis protein